MIIHVTTRLRCILIDVCKTTKAFIELIMLKYVQSIIITLKEQHKVVFDFFDHLLFSKVVFVF